MNILNGGQSEDPEEKRSAEELAKQLQKNMLCMKGSFMTADGRGVDYSCLASSDTFREYVAMAQLLAHCDLTVLSEDARKAFFINVYNCLTIHGLAASSSLPSSVLDAKQFWKNTAYIIGSHTYSLDDMEHGILRGNRPHPSSDMPPFSKDDPRRPLAMSSCDPRVHFALVCGAKSCPPIQVYSASNLDHALNMAATSFCSQEVGVDQSGGRVRLSKIFLWYGTDFGKNERELLRYLISFVDQDARLGLEQLLSSDGEINITFTDYNWQLNKL